MTLINLIKEEYSSKFQFIILIILKKAREATKIRKDVALGWNYRGYGENLGRGAIGKSNVESWTWRKPRVIYG